MGKGLAVRRKEVLTKLRKERPQDIDTYRYMNIVRTAIDAYIESYGVKECEDRGCDSKVGPRNKTGLCRTCYMRKYRKKDEQKRLDALRQKYYRKKKSNKLKEEKNV